MLHIDGTMARKQRLMKNIFTRIMKNCSETTTKTADLIESVLKLATQPVASVRSGMLNASRVVVYN